METNMNNVSKISFERIQMIKDDSNHWMLFVKPEGRESFAVYPDERDLERFWLTLKYDSETIDELRTELASKYLEIVEDCPELKAEIFGSKAKRHGVDRIKGVDLFKTKEGCIYCAPTIRGMGRVEPRLVTPWQWQRMWLADDRAEYKRNLAATLFDNILRQEETQPAEEEKSTPREVSVR